MTPTQAIKPHRQTKGCSPILVYHSQLERMFVCEREREQESEREKEREIERGSERERERKRGERKVNRES